MAQGTLPATRARRESRWAAVRSVGGLVTDFREGARALPQAAWRRWLQVTLIGLVLCAALASAISFAGSFYAPRGLQSWDERMLLALLDREPISFHSSILLESPGNLLGMALLVIPSVIIAIKLRRPLVAANLLSLYYIGTGVLWAGWLSWDRDRPDLVLDGIAAPGLHSMPSGHIMHVTAVYGFLAYLWVRSSRSWLERLLAILLCSLLIIVVGLARLMLGAHWPSDTIAGTVIGLAWMLVAIVAMERAQAAR